MKKWLLILLFVFPAYPARSAPLQNWVYYGINNNEYLFMDYSNFGVDAPWVIFIPKNQTSSKYNYVISQFSFYCKNNSLKVLRELTYSKDGSVINEFEAPEYEKYKKIVPGTIGEYLYSEWCETKTIPPSNLTSIDDVKAFVSKLNKISQPPIKKKNK